MTRSKEQHERINALYQWLYSQSIPRHDWGSLFAIAAGKEVSFIAKKHNSEDSRVVGLLILQQLMEINA